MEAITNIQEPVANVPANLASIQKIREKNDAIGEAFNEKAAELQKDFNENKSLSATAGDKVSLSVQALNSSKEKAQTILDSANESQSMLETFNSAVEKTKERKQEKAVEEYEEAELEIKRAEQEARFAGIGTATNLVNPEKAKVEASQEALKAENPTSIKKQAVVQTGISTSSLQVSVNTSTSSAPTPRVNIQV